MVCATTVFESWDAAGFQKETMKKHPKPWHIGEPAHQVQLTQGTFGTFHLWCLVSAMKIRCLHIQLTWFAESGVSTLEILER